MNKTGEDNEQNSESKADKKTDIDSMTEEFQKMKERSEEYLNNWKRAQADFINYKRRQNELFGEMMKSASMDLIMEILPIYETFNIATDHIPDGIKNEEWVKGVVHIKSQLGELLKSKGLEELKSVGENFDPELHEAVEIVESGNKDGEIVGEIQKGYKINGKLIRVAKVKVAKKKEK